MSQGLVSELPVQRICLFSLVASDSVSEQLPSQQGPVPSHPPCQHAHTHLHGERVHLTITHALQQPCLNRIMTHSQASTHTHTHARHQHPGKADLSLSWITDIHTASCPQNNLISLTPSLRLLQRGACLRHSSL